MIELKTGNATAKIFKNSPAVEMQQWEITNQQERQRLKSPHFHTDYQIGFVTSGVIENTYRRVKQLVAPDRLYVIQPGEVHSEYSVQPSTLRLSFAFIDSAHLTQTITDLTDGKQQSVINKSLLVQHDFLNRHLIRQTAGYFSLLQRSSSKLEQESTFITWITAVLASQAEEKLLIIKPGNERRAIEAVKSYLQDNVAEQIPLDLLSEVACLSKYHLLRTFAKATGITIHHYQMQLKICRAKELLKRRKPIAQVALELGFSDQAHFSNCFKRFTSQTPGQF